MAAHGAGAHGHHGNPADLDAYIARMEEPERAQWQKPDEVIAALQLKPGQVACDIGAGPGYFSLRLARAVGDSGHVFAVDAEPRILEALRKRIDSSKAKNVSPVLALADDPLLPRNACDLILIVDTYHHFPDGAAYLRRLSRSLRPGGKMVNIDFHKRDLPVGPPLEHKVSREAFLKEAPFPDEQRSLSQSAAATSPVAPASGFDVSSRRPKHWPSRRGPRPLRLVNVSAATSGGRFWVSTEAQPRIAAVLPRFRRSAKAFENSSSQIERAPRR